MTTKTLEEIRTEIDDEIDWLWAEGNCMNLLDRPDWPGYAIIEGLKRARYITGEQWQPDEGYEGWKRFTRMITPTFRVMKDRREVYGS